MGMPAQNLKNQPQNYLDLKSWENR